MVRGVGRHGVDIRCIECVGKVGQWSLKGEEGRLLSMPLEESSFFSWESRDRLGLGSIRGLLRLTSSSSFFFCFFWRILVSLSFFRLSLFSRKRTRVVARVFSAIDFANVLSREQGVPHDITCASQSFCSNTEAF